MGNWHISSTDLWYDADGQVSDGTGAISFFYVSPAETGNVTIDGTRASGVNGPGKVVYAAGNYYNGKDGHGYSPCVREMYDSAIARSRKVVGVTAGPAQINRKVGVYTQGIVKVKLHRSGGTPNSTTCPAGHFVMGTYHGDVVSTPAWTANGVSWIDCVLGKAIQSAGAGDEFLIKLGM